MRWPTRASSARWADFDLTSGQGQCAGRLNAGVHQPLCQGAGKIPLSRLMTVKECVSPHELNNFGQRWPVSITASLMPDHSLSDALRFMGQTVAKVFKTGDSIDLSGTTCKFRNLLGTLLTIFGVPAMHGLLARRAVSVANATKVQEAPAGHKALAAR